MLMDSGGPWLRFTDDLWVLLMFGAGSLALTAGLLAAMPPLRALVRWGRPDLSTIGLGLGGDVPRPSCLRFCSLHCRATSVRRSSSVASSKADSNRP